MQRLFHSWRRTHSRVPDLDRLAEIDKTAARPVIRGARSPRWMQFALRSYFGQE
ncbi:MAG: hypothetical protein NT090_12855 [Acidobacteria bacterium]|nr:hypothetical protein [Acidobacteriota bacterium]